MALDMPHIDDIRRLWSEGRDVTEIARMTGHDRKTVRKYLQMEGFSPEAPAPKAKGPSRLDPFKDHIDRTLEADLHEWRKQRHTAARIYGEILGMGYEGRYSLVQCYVRERKRAMRQASSAFLDLVWAPGTAQCDFGEADFWRRGRKARLYFLVLAFPHSNMGWFQVFGGTTAECVCEGLIAIFLHMGGVPHRIVFDNATGIGGRVAGEVRESSLFRRFRLHFGFEATFCNPHAGHEKGSVESKVGFVRRNAFVPVPDVGDLAGYNESLLAVADSWAGRRHYRRGATCGELFGADRAALVALPARPFSATTWLTMGADKWGEVTLAVGHRYLASADLPLRDVHVGLSALAVTIVDPSTGEVAAAYDREFGTAPTTSADPVATLSLLRSRPGAWRESDVRDKLPGEVVGYLDALTRDGLRAKLGALHDASAIEGFDVAAEAARRLVARGGDFSASDLAVMSVRVAGGDGDPDPGPDLRAYDVALMGREAV